MYISVLDHRRNLACNIEKVSCCRNVWDSKVFINFLTFLETYKVILLSTPPQNIFYFYKNTSLHTLSKRKLHNRFRKDQPFFIRNKAIYYHESRRQTEQTQESKRNNKQATGKQHADNQSEGEKSHSSEKGEKEE